MSNHKQCASVSPKNGGAVFMSSKGMLSTNEPAYRCQLQHGHSDEHQWKGMEASELMENLNYDIEVTWP